MGSSLQGWITSQNVLQAVARQMHAVPAATGAPRRQPGRLPRAGRRRRRDPLPGYQVLEVAISAGLAAAGQTLGDTTWPPGWIPVTVLDNHTLRDPDPGITLTPGDRVNLLSPAPDTDSPDSLEAMSSTSRSVPRAPGGQLIHGYRDTCRCARARDRRCVYQHPPALVRRRHTHPDNDDTQAYLEETGQSARDIAERNAALRNAAAGGNPDGDQKDSHDDHHRQQST